MILDNQKLIKKLDKQGMLGSIESLGLQCQQAWDDVKKIKVPKNYRHVKNILINGMGGSGLGGHIIESLYGREIKVPFKVINSYNLPGFVNSQTLYILSSYSGTTEEILATFNEARKRNAKLLIICAGGKLAQLAKRYKIPAYIFNPIYNPSNQPRMGLGYSVFGQLGLIKKSGLIKLSDSDVSQAIQNVVLLHQKNGFKNKAKQNKSKILAKQLHNKIVVIVGAEHLSGNAHVIANQINENSKNFSAYFLLSELNHHLMEGLIHPVNNTRQLHFLFINSPAYSNNIIKRLNITKQVLRKNNIGFSEYKTVTKSKLSQVAEVLLVGSYVNYYLALLYGIDPSPIPYVDYFKKKLKN